MRFPVDEVLEGLSVKRSSVGLVKFCPKNMVDDGNPDRLIVGREGGQMGGAMTLVGYARVSTTAQDAGLQLDALSKVGCTKIFEDQISGAKAERPGLDAALAYLRDGDTLAVWKLDRLGRSLPHLIETVTTLGNRGVGFRSLTEGVDTCTPNGRLVFHIFGALAEFERDLIRERTEAGLAAAVARGRKGGRRPVITAEKLARAETLIASGLNAREAAARIKVSKTALYAALADKKP